MTVIEDTSVGTAADPEAIEFDPFSGQSIERVISTSEAQREVWLAAKLSTQASLAFNESVSLTFVGPLDVGALSEALNNLTQRHDSLRCTLGPDGTELLINTNSETNLAVTDLRSLGHANMRVALEQAAVAAVETPFDLERGPLWRAALLRTADSEYQLLMTAHHIVCDGWSWAILFKDLGMLYAEKLGLSPSPDPAPSYSDYLAWEAEEAAGPSLKEIERYWLGRFTGTLPVLDLPRDRRRPALRSFGSRRKDHVLDADLTGQLRSAGAKMGVSSFAVLFSGFAAILHRLTGQDDLVIGVPSAGQSASGMTDLVGHCVNLLPIRITTESTEGFDALVVRSTRDLLDGLERQSLTFGSLLKKLPLQRDFSRPPLVSVMFNLDQEARIAAGSFPDLGVSIKTNPRHFENFELFLNAVPNDNGIRLECQYNTDLFDEVTVERWLRAYETLLRSAVEDVSTPIGKLNLLSAENYSAILAFQPSFTPAGSDELMHSAFVAQSRANPLRRALSDTVSKLNYGDLDQRSNKLASALRKRGVQRGARVGICLSRGTEAIVAVLAVLKAGGTYIPMDPSFPAARLAHYAEDAKLALLLVDAAAAEVAPRGWCSDAHSRILQIDGDPNWLTESAEPLTPSGMDASPESAAYIIYTSGSTGIPKGVCIPHRAVANFLTSMQREPGLGPDDTLAAVTTLSFDIAVLEFMLPLTVGAHAVIVPTNVAMDGARLRILLESSSATMMQATPSLWRLLLDTPWRGGKSFRALIGGESCPPDLALQLLGRVGELWNMYGPTETTIWSTLWRVDAATIAERGMLIGRPIANTVIWVLDGQLQPCPIGVPGELCIGGAGLALEYLNQSRMTEDRFVRLFLGDSAGERVYRTGDRGRWLNNGMLEHMGRLDLQVKVRGYRIELGEIEAQCTKFDSIAESTVVAREEQAGDVRLIAYIVSATDTPVDEKALRDHLSTHLPAYMLPQHIVQLAALPLLPNGKLNRKALPSPQAVRHESTKAGLVPRDDIERNVTKAMEEVLNLPGLSIEDDFFAMGGHSLLAARLTAQLNRHFELDLPLSTLFQAPTAEKLSIAIKACLASGTPKRLPVRHQANRTWAPLTPMQQRVIFVEELQGNRLLYNTPSAHRLSGTLNYSAFKDALQEIVRRQPALRTRIGWAADGSAQIQLIAGALLVDLPVEDLTAIETSVRETELMRRMQAVVDTPLDISEAPMFRAVLYRLREDEHAFLFMPHHLIWDGWSFDLLYEEMSALYAAFVADQPSPLEPLAITYGDYAEWYGEWSATAAFDEQLQYWKRRFANTLIPLPPRLDYQRRAGMTGEGATEWVRIDGPMTQRLRDVARMADSTLNMLTLAIYVALMTNANESDSIILGLPVRGRISDGTEQVMGFFNNLLAVGFSVDASLPALTLVSRVKQELIEVFAHQEVPFERVAAEPEVSAIAQRAGLYQALFSFQDARERKRQWGGLEHTPILLFQKGATEDLGLWLMERNDGMEGGFTYNVDIYKPETARAFRARYLELLNRLIDNPKVTIGELTSIGDSDSQRYLSSRRMSKAGAESASPVNGAAGTLHRPRNPSPAANETLSKTEREMTELWTALLRLPDIHVDDNFFDIGGYSLLAMDLIARIESRFGKSIKPATLISAATIRQLSAVIDGAEQTDSLVPLRTGGKGITVFFVHDADGATLLYRNLALQLHPKHAVYGLQPHSDAAHAMLHTRVHTLVDFYVQKIRAIQPHGPYVLGGLCAGGMIAFEIALQLQEAGEEVRTVALIDAADVGAKKAVGLVTRRRVGRLRASLNMDTSDNASRNSNPLRIGLAIGQKIKAVLLYEIVAAWNSMTLAIRFKILQLCLDRQWQAPAFARGLNVRNILSRIELGIVRTRQFKGSVTLFRATQQLDNDADEPFMHIHQDPLLGWRQRVDGVVNVVDVPAGHSTMLQEPHVRHISRRLQEIIDSSHES